MDYPNIMDFEASGFGAESYPIEVGFSLSSEERYCALIQPHPSWQHWDPSAAAIHGISRELLQSVGLPVTEVCEELNRRLTGLVLYSDAWVVDKAWFNRLFETANIAPQFQLCAIEQIQSECQYLVWDKVRNRMLKESTFERHRASADAFFIQQVFWQTRTICSPS